MVMQMRPYNLVFKDDVLEYAERPGWTIPVRWLSGKLGISERTLCNLFPTGEERIRAWTRLPRADTLHSIAQLEGGEEFLS